MQFSEICNGIYTHFRNTFESILLGEIFELNDRKHIGLFTECGKMGYFRR